MAKVCMVTGAGPRRGGTVSFSHKRGKRWFRPNLQRKRYWVPTMRRHVTLTVSTKGIKVITRDGIDKVMADLTRRGVKV